MSSDLIFPVLKADIPDRQAIHAFGLDHCSKKPCRNVDEESPIWGSCFDITILYPICAMNIHPKYLIVLIKSSCLNGINSNPNPISKSNKENPIVAPETNFIVTLKPWLAPDDRAIMLTGPGEIDIDREKIIIANITDIDIVASFFISLP